MVSEWMKNGHINEFLRTNVNADRLEFVCFFCSGLSSSLVTDDRTIAVVKRYH